METVPADFEGGERAISFSPHYLLDGLDRGAGGGPGRAQPGPAAGDTAQAGAAHRCGGQDGSDAPAADPGQIRLEFTTAAKPALITWAGGRRAGLCPARGPFRYLVVPLRAVARS